MNGNLDGKIDPSQPREKSQENGQVNTPGAAWGVSAYHFLIVFVAIFWTFKLERMCGIDHGEITKQVYALIFGGLGGAVAASRWVVYSVRHNAYDRKRMLWQLLTPVYSAVLAWVGVIALAGGILILASSPSPLEPQFTFFVMGFAFLVGFASESFSHRLIMAARTLFGERIEEEELKVTGDDKDKK